MDTEFLIVGAGVYGLNIARSLKQIGREVLVVDRTNVGEGASATPLGVLAPHTPDGWNDKKAQQFAALSAMPEHIAELEVETGLKCGYRRSGRLIPLLSEHIRTIWQSRARDAKEHWQGFASIDLLDVPKGWITAEHAPHGVARCGLSASLDARAYLAALASSVGEGRILSGRSLTHIETCTAYFEGGKAITARHIIVATGVDAFRFLADLPNGDPAGRGEKGQAAVLRLPSSVLNTLPGELETLPFIYSDRRYVVPRGSDTVAVGATSERHFESPDTTDHLFEEIIEQVREICPALQNAKVIERWARLRPRSADRKPLVIRVPGNSDVTVATGGFKTGLAMGHVIGKRVAARLKQAIES